MNFMSPVRKVHKYFVNWLRIYKQTYIISWCCLLTMITNDVTGRKSSACKWRSFQIKRARVTVGAVARAWSWVRREPIRSLIISPYQSTGPLEREVSQDGVDRDLTERPRCPWVIQLTLTLACNMLSTVKDYNIE